MKSILYFGIMSLHIISSATYKPDDRPERAKAKAELWNYLKEIAPDVKNWQPDEIAEQIAHTAMRILHPHFTGVEIEQELLNVFTTLRISHTISDFPSQFAEMVLSKIKNR